MKIEVPEFKRCCCCIPLRYGLLFWGYVKLIASVVFLGMMVFIMIATANRIERMTSKDYPVQRTKSYFIWDIILIVFLTLLLLLEISINIVFLIGGHKKILKLMKVFYYYNIVVICLYVFAFSVATTIEFMFVLPYIMRSTESLISMANYVKIKLGAGILNAVIQLYFILLTRSEIRKLQNQSNFSFKNNAAEAECNMEPKDRNIDSQSNDISDQMTEVNVNGDNGDVFRNNNIKRDKDEKLKLNKYQLIKNIDVENI